MKKLTLLLSVILAFTACKTVKVTDEEIKKVQATLDYGDYKSATLAGKCWDASGRKAHMEVIGYASKCVEMYGEEGKKQNASLTDFAPAEKAHDYWALNDVGTCLFILANTYKDLGLVDKQRATLRNLVDNYIYSQCWDPKGWFWQPAKGMVETLEELELMAE